MFFGIAENKKQTIDNKAWAFGNFKSSLSYIIPVLLALNLSTGCSKTPTNESENVAPNPVQSATPLASEQKEAKSSSDASVKIADLSACIQGQHVAFGTYPQQSTKDSASQPIQWLVLEKNGDKALLISSKGLDSQQYYPKDVDVTWSESSLRKWLNEDFYNTAFTDKEKAKIISSHLENPPHPKYKTPGGEATDDKVYLLSIGEVETYLKNPQDKVVIPTHYASYHGAFSNSVDKAGWWWLRSPGGAKNDAAGINDKGLLISGNVRVKGATVRPVILVDTK